MQMLSNTRFLFSTDYAAEVSTPVPVNMMLQSLRDSYHANYTSVESMAKAHNIPADNLLTLLNVPVELTEDEKQVMFTHFALAVDDLRKRSKGKWYGADTVVCGKRIRIKAHGNWMQVYEVSGIDCSNAMERTVAQFRSDLLGVLLPSLLPEELANQYKRFR